MPQITVPKSFFVNERRMYSDWMFAFWREFFQNSVDAGATRIDITTSYHGDNSLSITFADNGCGMDRDTIENVYFKLGASTKNDDSSIGGFGRARILTCFSMKNYTIRTRDNFVEGDGGAYEIKNCEYLDGTEINVSMEDESFYSLVDHLHNYLRMSQLPCRVFHNGVEWKDWCHRRAVVRNLSDGDIDFATVHVNKSKQSNYLLVRVNGAVMYYQYISTPAQIIVELDQLMSRTVLAANRDCMQSRYSCILNRFIQELATETETALKPRFARKNAKIRGRGLFVSRAARKNQPVSAAEKAQESVDEATAKASEGRTSEGLPVAEVTGKNSDTLPQAIRSDGITVSHQSHGSEYPDIYIVDETDNPKVRRVIDSFHPDNWETIYSKGRVIRKGNNIYKLLMLWKVACQHAVEALQQSNSGIGDLGYAIGWLFSDQADARCMTIEGGHAFLLNPVSADGCLKYYLSSQSSHKQLMAYAKHEVAHVVSMSHTETYANILTQIDVNYDEREVYRAMREQIALMKQSCEC